MPGKLYLIPVPIAEGTAEQVIPPATLHALAQLDYFLAENIRTARRFISSLKVRADIQKLRFEKLNQDTPPEKLRELMAPVLQGVPAGVLSESGCPGVADPGHAAVAYAHAHGVEVIPLPGPSSIIMALMGSGLNGQAFCFNGYLPVKHEQLVYTIRRLEQESATKKCTQILIETPYRNQRLFHILLRYLSPATRLCVAYDITGGHQQITTLTVSRWRSRKVSFNKLPAVFLFQA